MAKITIKSFRKAKKEGRKLVLITCYDYTFARIVSASDGIDGVLVGDSLGMVIKGEGNTLNVSVEEMEYHVKAVKRGLSDSLLIADMPFGSYQTGKGVENAIRLMKAGAEAVKVEGGSGKVIELIKELTAYGVPVMGHLGMTPQYIHGFGGYRLRGRTKRQAERLLEEARRIEEAGAFALVLEMVPEGLAKSITESLKIPVIGIGAGRFTDGQILVIYDVLGLYQDIKPKFVKQYLKGFELIKSALNQYIKEVREGLFPSKENVYESIEEN